MKKKVFILGGAGFIGYNLTKYLAENRDYEITIGDNFFRGQMDDWLSDLVQAHNIKVVEADFTDPIVFDQLDDDYNYFYMLASMVGVGHTLEIPHEIIRVNTALIYNSLEWLKKSEVKKVLFTSTSECYAGTIESFGYAVPTSEEIPLCIDDISHPRFTYAVTKMLGESGFLNYSRKCGFDATVVRYHNVYGPRMGFKHVIPNLAERFMSGETDFQVYGHDQTRAFSYIIDAVEGTVMAMESLNSSGEIYHIGSMEEISIEELVKETGKYFNYEGEYVNAPTYPGSVSRRCPDISKAKKELGYQPKVDWKEGLAITLDWYKSFFKSGQKTFESSFEKPSV